MSALSFNFVLIPRVLTPRSAMRALSSFTVSFFSSSRAGTRDLSPAGASVSISADIADRGVTISLRKGGDREKSSRVGEESGRDGAPWLRRHDDAVVAVVVVVVGTKADATKGRVTLSNRSVTYLPVTYRTVTYQ